MCFLFFKLYFIECMHIFVICIESLQCLILDDVWFQPVIRCHFPLFKKSLERLTSLQRPTRFQAFSVFHETGSTCFSLQVETQEDISTTCVFCPQKRAFMHWSSLDLQSLLFFRWFATPLRCSSPLSYSWGDSFCVMYIKGIRLGPATQSLLPFLRRDLYEPSFAIICYSVWV